MLDNFLSPRLFVRDGKLYFRPPRLQSRLPDIVGGRYSKAMNAFQVPPIRAEVRLIQRLYPNVCLGPGVDQIVNPPIAALSREHPKWNELYRFQREVIEFLVGSPKPGALVALSPRLGKTVCSIVAAELLDAQNVLIVAPLSLLSSWKSEIERWGTNREAQVRHRKGPVDGWNVTNYDTVVNRLAEYKARDWDVLVVDESLMIKNRHTHRFKAIATVAEHSKKVWLLSGSPISRDASDLWTQFRTIYPEAFPSFWRFAAQTCELSTGVPAWEILRTKSDFSLAEDYGDLAIVRSWRDVCDQMPVIQYLPDVVVGLGAEQRAAYESMQRHFVAELAGEELTATTKLAQMTRLQQIASNLINVFPDKDVSAKADALLELLSVGALEFPLLVWVHWVPGAYALYERMVEQGFKVGISTGKERDTVAPIEAYKNGKFDILLLSQGVGKYGLTLTNTLSVVYYDVTFDGDAYFQSSHRAIKPGLDHSVAILRIRAGGTIDELVERNLTGKMIDISKMTNADLLRLIRPLTGKFLDTNGNTK